MRTLAKQLGRGSAVTVGRILKPLGYSLKTNVKRLIGKPHPDRNRQYCFIQRAKALFIKHGEPVISIDAKKSELIGNFKNTGTRYCKKADEVNTVSAINSRGIENFPEIFLQSTAQEMAI